MVSLLVWDQGAKVRFLLRRPEKFPLWYKWSVRMPEELEEPVRFRMEGPKICWCVLKGEAADCKSDICRFESCHQFQLFICSTGYMDVAKVAPFAEVRCGVVVAQGRWPEHGFESHRLNFQKICLASTMDSILGYEPGDTRSNRVRGTS